MNYDFLNNVKIVKRNKFVVITKEQVTKAVEEYLAGGGVIQKIKTEDQYYSIKPYNCNRYSTSKGSINGEADY